MLFYLYYSNKDVNKAKEYLDKYVANADKDPKTDYFVAEYLFRAGKNQESIAKAKELEASAGLKEIPRLSILYAYNYDRLNDSVQAKVNIEKFFAAAPADKIEPTDYDLAVKVFTKFPGSEMQAAAYLEKAIANDTSKVNKLNYMGQAADMFFKAKMPAEVVKWLERQIALKGSMSEADHYKLTSSSLLAKDYPKTIQLAKNYMAAYPDRPQPYTFFKRAAIASDPDTSKGIAIEYLTYLDSIYSVVNKEKYKKDIFINMYFIINAYINKLIPLKKIRISTIRRMEPERSQWNCFWQPASRLFP